VSDAEEVYLPYQEVAPPENRFWKWLRLNFRKRKVVYVGGFVLVCLASLWIKNWFPPLFFLVVAIAVTRIIRALSKTGRTWVIECRIQGEIIRHCNYYQKPIQVPSSWIRIHVLPHSRLKDVLSFGDNTPPVKTQNIVIVDYYEERPTGEILMVYPQDANFSNFALQARVNPDVVSAMREMGAVRKANMDFRDVAVEMFHSGKLGGDPVAAGRRLRQLLLDYQVVESKMANSAAAKRAIWLYYKATIPTLHKHVVMFEQELPRLAMAEAAKLAHISFGHPMSQDLFNKLQAITTRNDPLTYDDALRRLVAPVESGDVHETKRNIHDGTTATRVGG
jgi:hypothetical protein